MSADAGMDNGTEQQPLMADEAAGEQPAADQPAAPAQPPSFSFHSKRLLDFILLFTAVCTLLITRYFRPGLWTTVGFALASFPAGLAMSFVYFKRKRDRLDKACLYSTMPGTKGLLAMLQRLPTWVSLSDTERAEWLNSMLRQMWPFYDHAVCEQIKESMAPIFESVKPAFISHIGFAKLQFGDAPIRIESVRYDKDRKEIIKMEIDFRWAGEPEIQLEINTLGSDAVRICPKISNIRMVGTLGLHLRPLIDEIPCFGAILVTMITPPKLNYKVDLGALGGNITGGAVAKFVDNLLPTILESTLVWPQRIVVPLFSEEVIGPLEDLSLRHHGVLKVQVLEARDLPRMDAIGLSDPFLEFFTDPKRKLKTATIKKTLEPKWKNEVHYLMVQEPHSQYLRYEMFDVDFVNAKKMFTRNIVKGMMDTVGATETMGKGQIHIGDTVLRKPGDRIESWYPIGSEDWTADDGPGHDRGEVKLALIYVPLKQLNPKVGDYGALFITVRKGKDFPRMVTRVEGSCNPYYVCKVGDEKKHGITLQRTTEPDWSTSPSVDFYGVSNTQQIKIKFFHNQRLADENLGFVNIEISDVRGDMYRDQHGCTRKWYDLQDSDNGTTVEIEVLFVAYF